MSHFIRSTSTAVVAVLALSTSVTLVPAITIPVVPVGNPGNAADVTGFGAVSYAFQIGKYEVSNAQYAAFLNAVAKTDTYELYTPYYLANEGQGGIVQHGTSGTYSYEVKAGMENKPITFMSFWNAARFANWLNNGQPTGAQDTSTTEDGAYTLNGYTGNDGSWIVRNPGATWFIPSENEWYKAAYYKNNGNSGDYWLYPTQSNVAPDSDQPPGTDAPNSANTANIVRDDGLANGYDDGYAVSGSPSSNIYTQTLLTDGGAYSFAPSAYGTFDQGGNVWEWIDTIQGGLGQARVMRGGGYSDGLIDSTVSSFQSGASPEDKFHSAHGFRMATVPEPSISVMAVLVIAIAVMARGCSASR